MITRSSID